MRQRSELKPYRPGFFLEPRDLVNEMFRSFFGPETRTGAEGWAPAAEVFETPQAYLVNIDAPGINPEEVQVTLVGDTLTVHGERKAPERSENESLHVSECAYGTFTRSFTFPAPVAADGVEASSKHGVLTVTVTKAKEAQPRRIQVKSR
jgi:HSP20 family protein